MAKRSDRHRVLGKALDLWQAPPDSGEPCVCLATTFTFDATFFETECLGRFLQLDSHPSEGDSVEYLIEREEKLSATRVAVLVDQQHASDKESMRWDVLSVRAPHGVLHAKIAVLCWARWVRVIIGSGNLTEPGYRKNVEVFGTTEIQSTGHGPVDQVLECLDFLDSVLDFSVGSDDRIGPRQRTRAAINSIRNQIRAWPKGSYRERYPTPLFSGLGTSVLQQLREHWPGSSAPWWASVISPFFDSAPNDRVAARALFDILSKRHKRQIHFGVPFEDLPDGSKRIFISKGTVDELVPVAEIFVHQVLHEQQGEIRPLHAKEIFLANDDWRLLLIGSSNFTRAGLGTLSTQSNLEANLAYQVRADEKAAKIINEAFPEMEGPVDLDSSQIIWNPAFNDDGEGTAIPSLPSGFEEVLYRAGEHPTLCLFMRTPLPEIWIVKIPGGEILVSSESQTATADTCELDWTGRPVPFVLEVCWKSKAVEGVAAWLVNVENPSTLLPPDVLRDLSLEEFLEILGSTRPLHKSVAAVLRKRKRKHGKDIELDPLKRVNSEEFLLRRTQRVALALERLRERLERPVLTSDALEWRISGPFGPKALAEVFVREAKQPAEAAFFLAELSLTVGRIAPERPAAGGLPKEAIRIALNDCVNFLRARIDGINASDVPLDIWNYVQEAFQEALK